MHRAALPTNEYRILPGVMVPYVCQPQYRVQKPEVVVTSDDVNTKYTPLVLYGNRPEVMALVTMVLMSASFKREPRE